MFCLETPKKALVPQTSEKKRPWRAYGDLISSHPSMPRDTTSVSCRILLVAWKMQPIILGSGSIFGKYVVRILVGTGRFWGLRSFPQFILTTAVAAPPPLHQAIHRSSRPPHPIFGIGSVTKEPTKIITLKYQIWITYFPSFTNVYLLLNYVLR